MGFNNGFDFRYTCPDINKSIDALKSDIESHIDNMIDILCPILGTTERNTLIKEYVEEFYSSDAYYGNFVVGVTWSSVFVMRKPSKFVIELKA
jgi:hypothetical protein